MNVHLLTFTSILLVSCGVLDSGGEDLVGDYSLSWVDTGCSMTIYKGEHGQMEGQVYEVGWNKDYIIAKRHPECDQEATDYFIIDIDRNAKSVKAGVIGPLDELSFLSKRKEFGVPDDLAFTLAP